MARIYISSTKLDLEAERRAVMDWLVAAGHQPVHSYTAASETVRHSCLEDVAECDVVVLILGHRYGFRPEDNNPEGLSITHLEFRRARSAGIPVVALFRTAIPNGQLSDTQDPEPLGALEDFHREVRLAVRPAQFEDLTGFIDHLKSGVNRELDKQRRRNRLSAPDLRERFRRASRDLLSWPTTLPRDRWLQRPELDDLLQQIGEATPSVHLLLGEPGCGKSALLARLGALLEQQSIPVLGIKADYLPQQLADDMALADYLELPGSPAACVCESLHRKGRWWCCSTSLMPWRICWCSTPTVCACRWS
ncbi:DUF4062 domain-containing protein [Thioalkalivibrio paradoxus]|uniref:DUF4062 domain-containing protein n=1 Tax=Thioalkalivibrio paradoxus ARh 1 TaxID=713585 RepID=W0DNM1_9GAMM|nr:DUF4062 domain-containing protein [Thioalkalivibrio paradoxus]AHF00062.1 hypothetical protein THITH_08270 [Thioalkalivibrio paradoxus ARh 1]